MTKTHIFSVAFLAISAILTSCQGDSAGEPCDYTQEKFNMVIIDVVQDPDQENHRIVYVDFDGNVPYASETQNLENVRDVITSVTFIETNHIQPGSIYKGTVHTKVAGSGDCEDEIIDWNQSFK